MKFRVTDKVGCFGVGTKVYFPGDIVEGPPEWVHINPFLEPIPEPKASIAAIASGAPAAEHIIVVGPMTEEEKNDEPQDGHATADRSAEER